MSFGYEHLRTRKQSEPPDEVSDDNGELQVLIPTETNEGHTHEVQGRPVSPVSDNDAQQSEAESTDVVIFSKADDKVRLITNSQHKDVETSGGIDQDGVAREYEVALEHLGFGLFHILLVVCNGLALTSDAVEVLSISFVLPVIHKELNLFVWQTGLLSSVIFIGMLVGSYFWGALADMIGRKNTLVFSLGVSGLFGLVSAFAPYFWLFLFFRLVSGFGVGGSLPVLFPYISEFIRNKYRGPYLGAQSVFWMFGRLLCGAIAWAIIPRTNIDFSFGLFRFHSWRLFILISAVPSVLGVVLYWFLPESPRYLLEVGKEKEAVKVLNAVFKMNHWRDKTAVYPVKSIQLGNAVVGAGREKNLIAQVKTVLDRTVEMFNRKLVFRTMLLLTIFFCLSFGSYGVTLWYPTYVDELNHQKDLRDFRTFCSKEVSGIDNTTLPSYCGCTDAFITNSTIFNTNLENWQLNDTVFSNVTLRKVNFTHASFLNSSFKSGSSFVDCTFSNADFTEVMLSNFTFTNVRLFNSRACYNGSQSVLISNLTISSNYISRELFVDFIRSLTPTNSTPCNDKQWIVKCPEKEDDFRVYRDSFFVSASALPGNLASMVAVYFLVRKYWLAFSLAASTLSVFLLYIVHEEAAVVVMLCLFAALSTPAWNDSSLIIAEVYPTHLRTTATGIHLVAARIGAIIGTNIFGEFVHVNPSIPIILVVVMLLIGAIAALPLPKTTRKTLLK